MLSRIRRPFTFIVTLLVCHGAAVLAHAETAEEANAEAERLYSRATDYVSHITEKEYSYAYIQFYWKRAQSNIDRIARVYPQTPTGRQVLTEGLKLGDFDLVYFRERVLPRLEEKRLAAFDAVNCAIFLYNRDEERWDEDRLQALASILEVLSRQQRWNEALSFPVLDEHRPLLLTTVFRIAARYKQQKLVEELIANASDDVKPLYWRIQAEAMVLTGTPREEIAAWLEEHPEVDTRLAVLSGMVDREIALRRATFLKQDIAKGVQKTHFSVLNPEVRDDVHAAARAYFPHGNEQADALVAKYDAALGRRPAATASIEQHLAYLEHLALNQDYEALGSYLPRLRLSRDDRHAAELKLIELYAQEGRANEARKLQASFSSGDAELADAAALAEFQGRMNSLEAPLTVRERTFAELNIQDPFVMAQAIMEWSLTPNRSIRGPAPYDSVVQKYLPGFENLPLPKSKDVQEASSTSKPF